MHVPKATCVDLAHGERLVREFSTGADLHQLSALRYAVGFAPAGRGAEAALRSRARLLRHARHLRRGRVEERHDAARARVGRRSRHHRAPLGGGCGGPRPAERAGPRGRGPGAAGDRNSLYARGDRDPGARGRRRDAGPRDLAATVQTARRRPGTDTSPHLVGPRRRCPRGGPRLTSRRGPGPRLESAVEPARTARSYGRRACRVLHRRALGRDGSRLRGQCGRPRDALASRAPGRFPTMRSSHAISRSGSTSRSETDDLARVSEHVVADRGQG